MSTKTVFPTLAGDADSFTSKAGVHRGFHSTGNAYDACQQCEEIRKGDVLVIERERVVGVADAWPLAVTVEHGDLHQYNESADEFIEGAANLPYGCIERARAEARRLGFVVRERA